MFNFIKNYFNNLYFKEVRPLLEAEINFKNNRIKDLEKIIESLNGENNILRESLIRAQSKEDSLLNKIFELTGVNKKSQSSEFQTTTIKAADSFIQLGRQGKNWSQVREELEKNAAKEYWENKQKDMESKAVNGVVSTNKEIQENANKITQTIRNDASNS